MKKRQGTKNIYQKSNFFEKLYILINIYTKIEGNIHNSVNFATKNRVFLVVAKIKRVEMTKFCAKIVQFCNFATKVRQKCDKFDHILKPCDKSATNLRRKKISACDRGRVFSLAHQPWIQCE